MQKRLIFISGTIGSGKTTLSNKLVYSIPNSVMLDGDWCFQQGKTWYFDKDTKNMAIDNIIYILNNYIQNPHFENIIFCWTLHKQEMLDQILNGINLKEKLDFYHFSIVCSFDTIKERIIKRHLERSKQFLTTIDQEQIQRDIIGAWKKTKFYMTNDTIKLDGNMDLESLYNELISNINFKRKLLK